MKGDSAVLLVVVNLLVGALGGSVAGVFVADYLRKKGRVWRVVSEWAGPRPGEGEAQQGARSNDTGERHFSFLIDLFNERAIGTGLRGVGVAFYGKGGERPWIAGLSSKFNASSKEGVTVINLPPTAGPP